MSMKKMLAVVAAASLVAVAAPAFAANPFSDVPMNHWAYDAIEQLSAKGILEGYPNGTYRGGRTMTRYEIACLVARLMNAGLTGEELERLKALVVEFQPELEALGVKVDDLDARVSSLEKGLKGWKISGEMRFDWRAYDKHSDIQTGEKATGGDGNGFKFDRARIFLHKDLDNGLQFDMRWHGNQIDRYWLTANDFLGAEGLKLIMGQWSVDWELDDGLTNDIDSLFLDQSYRGALLQYVKGPIEVQGYYASNRGHAGINNDSGKGIYSDNCDAQDYGGRIKLNFNEKIWVSFNVDVINENTNEVEKDLDGKNGVVVAEYSGSNGKYITYWAGLGFKVIPGLEIKGAYFKEDIDVLIDAYGTVWEKWQLATDDPDAYKIIVDVNQDLLKVTSLWLEYAHFDRGFYTETNEYSFDDSNSAPAGVGDYDGSRGRYTANNFPGDFARYPLDDDVDVYFVRATQKWNSKFKTDLRYVYYDQDNIGKAKEFSVELTYQYTPNLAFQLGWCDQDGRFYEGGVDEDYENNFIRFRTWFTF